MATITMHTLFFSFLVIKVPTDNYLSKVLCFFVRRYTYIIQTTWPAWRFNRVNAAKVSSSTVLGGPAIVDKWSTMCASLGTLTQWRTALRFHSWTCWTMFSPQHPSLYALTSGTSENRYSVQDACLAPPTKAAIWNLCTVTARWLPGHKSMRKRELQYNNTNK